MPRWLSVVIDLEGTEYGLNGDARGRGYAELDATLLIDYPNRVGTQPLIDHGLASSDVLTGLWSVTAYRRDSGRLAKGSEPRRDRPN